MSFWQKIIRFGFYSLFILVPLIWLPNTSELFEFPKILLTYSLTIIIVGAWIADCLTQKRFLFRRTPLDIPLLIFLGSNILSLLGSIDTHVSWYGYYSRWNGGLLSLISYSLLYWAFVSNMDSKSTDKLINCSLITAGIIAVYGGLEHFGVSLSCILTTGQANVSCWVQDVQNRVFATLGQPNWLAAYIVALIFVPISQLTSRSPLFDKERGNKGVSYWTNIGIFILLFSTLLFTKSRSGLLAFGISSIVFWGTPLLFPPTAKDAKRRFDLGGNLRGVLTKFGIWLLIIATLSVVIPNPLRDLLLKTNGQQPIANQGPALEVGGTESGSIRKIVWIGATRIWTSSIKNLIIGTGPETFAEAYYQFRPVEHNQTSEWELLYNKAHNEFLNYLATTGILGLGSYLILLAFMFKAFRRPQIALLAGWLTISITNFWGFSVVIIQLFLFLFPAIATVIEDGERSRIHDK